MPLPRVGRFVLQQTLKNSINFLKRTHTIITTSPEFTSNENITKPKIVMKRNYSSKSASCEDFDNPSVRKSIQLLDLNFNPAVEQDMKIVLKPYVYASSVPKKGFNSHLIKGFNYWMNLPNDLCETIEQLFNMSYESELMMDDIYDESDYRRGLPTAYKLYGVPQTLISGKVCIFIALKKLLELNNIKAIEAYADNAIQHYSGQYIEIDIRDNKKSLTIEEYEQICIKKTQPVISTIIKIMQAFSNCKTDFSQLSRNLGIYYQYLNDVSTLSDEKCWNTKGFCQDISEGKYTLAIIHAINTNTEEGDIVSAIVKQKTKDLPTLRLCLSLLEKLGSIDFVKKTLKTVEKELKEEIQRLGGNPPLMEFINAITSMKYEEEAEQSFL